MAKGSANAITLPNLAGSASQAQNLNKSLGQFNAVPGLTPEYTNIAQGVASGPYNAQAMQGAQVGANIAQGAAGGAASAGQNLTNLSNSLVPYSTSIMNAGFDPQGQLYNQQFQQMTDQQRALESAQGVAGTPYGAGLESQADLNFNTNWENQQLGREATAAGAAGSLGTAAAGIGQAGLGLGQGASQLAAQGGALPASTFASLGNTGLSALNALSSFIGSGAAIPEEQIGNIMTYLGMGPGYSQAQTQSNDAQNPLMAIAPIAGQGVGAAAGNPSLGALMGK